MPEVVQALKGGEQGGEGAVGGLLSLVHGGELIKAWGWQPPQQYPVRQRRLR